MAKEERSTGGGGEELSELESILEELIEIGEDTDQRAKEEATTRQILVDEDKAKAVEMRKRAMESMGETRDRHGERKRAMESMGETRDRHGESSKEEKRGDQLGSPWIGLRRQ